MFSRSYILVSGNDRYTFLNGLMTNDALKLESGSPLFAAFLNASGRFLFDAFLAEKDGFIVIDVDKNMRDDLFTHLSRYKLRAKVILEKQDESPFEFLWPEPFSKTMPHQERIQKGLPFGLIDVIPEKGFILECGYDELGAIDWQKGCYLGQELVAKTKYRGELRKKLMCITFDGLLESGIITTKDSNEAGDMRSIAENCALAMIRLEFIHQDLFVGEKQIRLAQRSKPSPHEKDLF